MLIDEIDKAPRDFPNDILNEIEHLTFNVRETGQIVCRGPQYRPILVLTSNSEKNLPDAFLRRCIFYHISFPARERLREIVARRLELDNRLTPQMLEHALDHFEEIRITVTCQEASDGRMSRVAARVAADAARPRKPEAWTG